jgi:SnoaL-like domain
MNTTSGSRRTFFLQGGAALGAGVVTAAGAASLANTQSHANSNADLEQQLACRVDLDAIRDLQITFMRLVEEENYDSIAALFSEKGHLHLSGLTATGVQAISKLFVQTYRQQCGTPLHRAYRPNASRQHDVISLNQDGAQASATYHVDVELVSPLQGDSTAAQMARLQGHQARHWKAGRFAAQYVKSQGHWRIASLSFPANESTASG